MAVVRLPFSILYLFYQSGTPPQASFPISEAEGDSSCTGPTLHSAWTRLSAHLRCRPSLFFDDSFSHPHTHPLVPTGLPTLQQEPTTYPSSSSSLPIALLLVQMALPFRTGLSCRANLCPTWDQPCSCLQSTVSRRPPPTILCPNCNCQHDFDSSYGRTHWYACTYCSR